MEIFGKTAVITGGAGGIGKALGRKFVEKGAKGVVLADQDSRKLEESAAELGVNWFKCDVTLEKDIIALTSYAEELLGPVDIFVSNAGVFRAGGEESTDSEWQLNWDVHVMAHVYAARAVAQKMAGRGSGYIVNTSSAAGLLTHVNSATYSVTKHAAVAFAEYLSATYGPAGVRVSVLCPQAVKTAMTDGMEDGVASVDGMIEPEELAQCAIETMDREDFLILPHPEVLEYMRRKTGDYNRWLKGIQRLKQQFPKRG
jgi:NAD(P)-dependent dehydrogenase (short-subunit alcohol dehydrogenase family)